MSGAEIEASVLTQFLDLTKQRGVWASGTRLGGWSAMGADVFRRASLVRTCFQYLTKTLNTDTDTAAQQRGDF